MISVIICHRNKDYLTAITKNIDETIGTPYELIIIDNTENRYSIFSAYNEGVKKSKYPVCCFTHEDVLFYTPNWGKNVVAHFEDNSIGMIGVTGSTVQPTVPSAWWYNFHYGQCAVNILEDRTSDVSNGSIKSSGVRHYYLNPCAHQNRTEVVIADGLWFCIRRSLFTHIRFDETTFSGFHLYDADISLQVRKHATVYVVYDVLLQHFSRGNTHKKYYTDSLKFTKKWMHTLPHHAKHISQEQAHKTAWYSLRRFLLDMYGSGFSKQEMQQVQQEYVPVLAKHYFSFWHWMYFKLSGICGYKLTNALFERAEKLETIPEGLKMKALPVKDVELEALKVVTVP